MTPSKASDEELVDASPTKGFFIDMLVRDIKLIPAIIDLADNSVDGARRMRDDGDFSGLFILIEIAGDRFQISDNCGGIPIDLARQYAFRFGRPPSMPATPKSIGQFGIGMKRALFKMGNEFEIVSTTRTEQFSIKDDVQSWGARDAWAFNFASRGKKRVAADKVGTTVRVTDLHPEVGQDFKRAAFITELAQELARVHQQTMDAGLTITLNTVPIGLSPLELLSRGTLQPAFEEHEFFEEEPPEVRVRLYAGIGTSSPTDAGWYVYCNGRLVLGPDQTQTTGWGTEKGLPRFHNQYSRFRGYAFFESADVSKLPWTTTKTGVDAGTPVYRNVRQRMGNLMKPVITFLNDLDREKDSPPADRTSLAAAVESAEKSPAALSTLALRPRFEAPVRIPLPVEPATTSIQYRRPKKQIAIAKKKLAATSASQVGERTFDYFYKRECSEDG